MKQMFLHIGAHRTGTTSVQQYLKDNVLPLKEGGIKYDRWGYFIGSFLCAQSPIDKVRSSQFSIEKAPWDKMVWSCEGFFGDFWDGYSRIGPIADDVKAILENMDTTVIAVVRKKDDFIKSLFSLYKKNSLMRYHMTRTREVKERSYEEHYNLLNAFSFNWDELLDEYRKRFKKVLVYNYEGLDVINTILEAIGAPIRNDSNDKEYRLNKSD